MGDFPDHVRARAVQLLNAARYAKEFLDICHAAGEVMPPAACRRALACACNHNALFRAAGGILAPKHHLFWEMARALPKHRNPMHMSTYPDETLNGIFARIARSVHPRTFAQSVLVKFMILCHVRGRPS